MRIRCWRQKLCPTPFTVVLITVVLITVALSAGAALGAESAAAPFEVGARPAVRAQPALFQVDWITQFGTPEGDQGWGIAINQDADTLIATGITRGSLAAPNFGGRDVWYGWFDAATGARDDWRQIGTAASDGVQDLAFAQNGQFYLTGATGSVTAPDFWISRYRFSDGEPQGLRFGGDVSEGDGAFAVAVAGNLDYMVGGWTRGALEGANQGGSDSWLRRYSADDEILWTAQFGESEDDRLRDIAVDTNDFVYAVGGVTFADDEDDDEEAWLVKYTAAGTLIWYRELGVSPQNDEATTVATGADGAVYLAGYTFGDLERTNAGASDIWIAKYDAAGNRLWLDQFGSDSTEEPADMAIGADGTIYLTGFTTGDLAGTVGKQDAWLATYNAAGERLTLQQFGSAEADEANRIAVDEEGNVYLVGATEGNWGADNAGSDDAFVLRLSPLAEEGSLADDEALATVWGDTWSVDGEELGPGDDAVVTIDSLLERVCTLQAADAAADCEPAQITLSADCRILIGDYVRWLSVGVFGRGDGDQDKDHKGTGDIEAIFGLLTVLREVLLDCQDGEFDPASSEQTTRAVFEILDGGGEFVSADLALTLEIQTSELTLLAATPFALMVKLDGENADTWVGNHGGPVQILPSHEGASPLTLRHGEVIRIGAEDVGSVVHWERTFLPLIVQ